MTKHELVNNLGFIILNGASALKEAVRTDGGISMIIPIGLEGSKSDLVHNLEFSTSLVIGTSCEKQFVNSAS